MNEVAIHELDEWIANALRDSLGDVISETEADVIMSNFNMRLENVFTQLRSQPPSIRFESMPVTEEQLRAGTEGYIQTIGEIIVRLIMKAFEAETDIYLLQKGRDKDVTLQ